MKKKQLQQIIDETYNFLNSKNVNFICYIWSKDGKYGGGCRSVDADMGDALLVIETLVKKFNIRPDALSMMLEDVRREMEKN